jgi:HK97 family phage major capsid protein
LRRSRKRSASSRAGAFNLAAQIWDKEDATLRVSENVNDHFIRNLVAILAEERLALAIYRSSAIVTGNVSPGS